MRGHRFNADTGSSMQWKFRPVQREVEVVPGETALAFFTATNPTDEAVIGSIQRLHQHWQTIHSLPALVFSLRYKRGH